MNEWYFNCIAKKIVSSNIKIKTTKRSNTLMQGSTLRYMVKRETEDQPESS